MSMSRRVVAFAKNNNERIRELRSTTKQYREVMQKLRKAKVNPVSTDDYGGTSCILLFELQQLRAVRLALGIDKFKHYGTDLWSEDKICVTLKCEQYPALRVTYVRNVNGNDKCQIVTKESPASTYRTLVCSR